MQGADQRAGNPNGIGLNSNLENKKTVDFKIPRKHYSQPKITYPPKLSIKYDDKIKKDIFRHAWSQNFIFLASFSGIHQNVKVNLRKGPKIQK